MTKAWAAAVTLAEAKAMLTASGAPFEMETLTIGGRPTRAYKAAPLNLRAVFDASRAWGARHFIVLESERLTFEGHWRAACALAHVLADKYGVRKGDRVAIAMRNLPEWSIAFWAGAIGAVITPLNGWGTGEDLAYGVSDSAAKVLVADAERLARITPHLAQTGVTGVVAVRTPPRDQLGSAAAIEDLIGPPAAYLNLSEKAPPDPGLDPEDDATILYTSGTTGRPKGAYGSQRNILSNLISIGYSGARAMVRRTGELPPAADPNGPQKAVLLPVPLFHVTGCHSMLVPAIVGGTKMVFMQRWSPERALELIEAEKVNAVTGVPTMIWQLLESPDFAMRDLSSIEGITYGGAAAAPELTERVKAQFPAIWPGQGYGATETSSVATANAGEDYLERPESVGPPVPVDDIRIDDPQGKVLATGEVGEICIFGPNVVKGYWNRPEATASAFKDGWYHTGDVGRMDEDGFVYVMDRIKDMLIRGGENIYCVEIEDALYAHPEVMDAAVVGIPHRTLGEEVAAVVRLRPGATADEGTLKGHVRKLLSSYKVPVLIEIRDEELPRNANGKTMKSVIREQLTAVKA